MPFLPFTRFATAHAASFPSVPPPIPHPTSIAPSPFLPYNNDRRKLGCRRKNEDRTEYERPINGLTPNPGIREEKKAWKTGGWNHVG
ncbi:MAG: hypothetical protein IJK84_02480 [Bacteroidales bacterium]|nr:hypothetical protein [Bacteroidales bacterium]